MAKRTRTPWKPLIIAVVLVGLVATFWLGSLDRRTDSAGATVTRFDHIHGLAFNPEKPGVLYMATHTGLFQIQEDQTWTRVGQSKDDFMGFAWVQGDPAVMYTSGHPAPGSGRPNPVGLRVSRDSGETWEDVSLAGEVDFHALSASPADPNVLYGWFLNDMYRSNNAGRDWEKFTPGGLEQAEGQVFALAAHPFDAEHVFAATGAGIAVSTDGAKTWRFLLEGGTVTSLVFHPANADHLLAYVAFSDGGTLIRSVDGGVTWTPFGDDRFANDPVGHLAIDPSDPKTIYAGTFNANLFKTNDGGATWIQVARQGRPLTGRNPE